MQRATPKHRSFSPNDNKRHNNQVVRLKISQKTGKKEKSYGCSEENFRRVYLLPEHVTQVQPLTIPVQDFNSRLPARTRVFLHKGGPTGSNLRSRAAWRFFTQKRQLKLLHCNDLILKYPGKSLKCKQAMENVSLLETLGERQLKTEVRKREILGCGCNTTASRDSF